MSAAADFEVVVVGAEVLVVEGVDSARNRSVYVLVFSGTMRQESGTYCRYRSVGWRLRLERREGLF